MNRWFHGKGRITSTFVWPAVLLKSYQATSNHYFFPSTVLFCWMWFKDLHFYLIDLVRSKKHLMHRTEKFFIQERYLWFWNSCKRNPDGDQRPKQWNSHCDLIFQRHLHKVKCFTFPCSWPRLLREAYWRQVTWGHARVLQPELKVTPRWGLARSLKAWRKP